MKEFVFDKNDLGQIKGPVIYKRDGNVLTPVVYFRKPKHASQQDFDAVVGHLIKCSKNL